MGGGAAHPGALGLGYILENRLVVAQQFPQAFRGDGRAAPGGQLPGFAGRPDLAPRPPGARASRVALLDARPRNETYFEHFPGPLPRHRARGRRATLTVREDKVYLKTLTGLERVHVLLRRVDDDFLDPLELRPDSQLGVPGLIQALRAGGGGDQCPVQWLAGARGSRPSGPAWPRPCWAAAEPLPGRDDLVARRGGRRGPRCATGCEFIVVAELPGGRDGSFDPVVGAELSPEARQLVARIEPAQCHYAAGAAATRTSRSGPADTWSRAPPCCASMR